MARRKFFLSPDIREALILAIDLAAQAKSEAGEDLDPSDVAELIGEGVEFGLEVVGLPDPQADKIGKLATNLLAKLEKAAKPDPEEILARATKAMREGDRKRARFLFDKAARVFERQEAKAKEDAE